MKKDNLDVRIMKDAGAGCNVNVIAAANEDRFTSATYSEEVTNFVVGVSGATLEPLRQERDLIMPPVHVGRRFEYKKSKGGLSFLADLDDSRAIGAEFNKVTDARENITARVPNRGLTTTIDRDDYYEGIENDRALKIIAILLRNDIRRGMGLLDAAATNAAKTWNADANPDGDMGDVLDAVLTERGIFPNTIVVGNTAWTKRRQAYESSDKAGALFLAYRTPKDVGEALGVEHIHRSTTVFKATKAGAKAQMVANRVFAFFRDLVVDKDDESNIKRFYCNCADGSEFRVYVDDSKVKTIDVTVEQYSLPAVTDATGIRKLTIS